MPPDSRRTIARANSVLRESKALRKISDQLIEEARELRASAQRIKTTRRATKRR